MSAEALLAREFGTLPDLIRTHAAERPSHAALVEGDAELNYAGLAALMDRIAFALQRDGVRSGEAVAICARTSINYAAAFCGILAAGAAVAPLAPSSTPASLMMMLNDSGARVFLLDRDVATALGDIGSDEGIRRVALDDCDAGAPFSQWIGPDGSKPVGVSIAPDHPFNIIYSSGTTGAPKGIVQPHRMRWAQLAPRLLQGRRDDRLDAALFEYDPRRLSSDARAWRHGGADAQIRRRRIPSPVAEAPRHPCDARSGAIPPDHGASGFRRVRSLELPC